jgi:hypothetical protein
MPAVTLNIEGSLSVDQLANYGQDWWATLKCNYDRPLHDCGNRSWARLPVAQRRVLFCGYLCGCR